MPKKREVQKRKTNSKRRLVERIFGANTLNTSEAILYYLPIVSYLGMPITVAEGTSGPSLDVMVYLGRVYHIM